MKTRHRRPLMLVTLVALAITAQLVTARLSGPDRPTQVASQKLPAPQR